MSDIRVSVRLDELRLSFSGSESFFRRHVDGLVEGALHQAAGRKGVAIEPSAAPVDGEAAEEDTAVEEQAEGVLVDAVPEAEQTLPKVKGFQPQSAHFAQFVRQVGNRAGGTDQQVMAFGFFLWNYEKQDEFTPEHLEGCFRTLGIPLPDDLAARLVALVNRKRFLQAGSEDDSYRLSNKGVNYVKNRLLAGN